jgi:hypothetical protein
MKDKGFINPFEGNDDNEYFWCLHCERVEHGSQWQKYGWWCPYPGCDGSLLDCSPWVEDSWPRRQHKEYPSKPIIGKLYPLYDHVPENFQDKYV